MRPDFVRLEQRLGIPLGMTLTALIAKAYEIAPLPSHAFAGAGLRLRWIDPDFVGTMDELRQPSTPTDVLPIIETGGDLQHFGFLMRRGAFPFFVTATDRRSIVNIVQDDPPAEPFAKNLRSLLSIAATVGLAGATRQDLRRRDAVEALNGEDFAEASVRLLTIPGVRRVDDLTSLLDSRELSFAYRDEPISPFKPPSRLPPWSRCASSALSNAKACVEHGFHGEALEFCDDVFAFIADGRLVGDAPMHSTLRDALRADLLRNAHFLRLKSLTGLSNPKRNREALMEAVEAFTTLPFVHSAYWLELLGLMKSLGVVDRSLRERIEAHARVGETDSL